MKKSIRGLTKNKKRANHHPYEMKRVAIRTTKYRFRNTFIKRWFMTLQSFTACMQAVVKPVGELLGSETFKNAIKSLNEIQFSAPIQIKGHYGVLEGETCNRNNCPGVIEEVKSEQGCSCHMGVAPCSSCCNTNQYCPECGWEK